MSRLTFGVPNRGRGRYSDPGLALSLGHRGRSTDPGHGLNSSEFSYPKMNP
jgi:hypothetical protein